MLYRIKPAAGVSAESVFAFLLLNLVFLLTRVFRCGRRRRTRHLAGLAAADSESRIPERQAGEAKWARNGRYLKAAKQSALM